jgi:hypothetical protein
LKASHRHSSTLSVVFKSLVLLAPFSTDYLQLAFLTNKNQTNVRPFLVRSKSLTINPLIFTTFTPHPNHLRARLSIQIILPLRYRSLNNLHHRFAQADHSSGERSQIKPAQTNISTVITRDRNNQLFITSARLAQSSDRSLVFTAFNPDCRRLSALFHPLKPHFQHVCSFYRLHVPHERRNKSHLQGVLPFIQSFQDIQLTFK